MTNNANSTDYLVQNNKPSFANKLVEEYAIAITINSIKYAVMMASPYDLEHFVIGFLHNEQVIKYRYDIHDIKIETDANNCTALIDVTVANRIAQQLTSQKRSIKSNSSCGICGVEAVAQALPKLAPLIPTPIIEQPVLTQAVKQLNNWQVQAKASGAMHAAALITLNGEIIYCSEDIGRHNAVDKTIGYLVNKELTANQYALLVTSRCSVELVHKAIIANISHLICLASPSQLAVNIAQTNHLNLVHVRKHDAPIYY
ncbi:formate dehydrogenase accessory sulfurtransferase FdhD [Thalassomonas sp. M1454]|uniref:formate dehydrogenase accessory sulfurtransferase FdhD n=1 Tax=Thalassomonas sp. M1454 TaxID=2594477 RepID=UPI00163D6BA2|nr:formate dehydrogenase accessory sulfurtransferase FdhD [Thalassomonas sp. M1454]